MSAITCKFGGSSLATAKRIRNCMALVTADADRRFVVVSAPGKRHRDDHKITDLLYAWYNIEREGLDASEPRSIIRQRFQELANDLAAAFDVDGVLDEIAGQVTEAATADFMVSRGEYLNARLVAEALDAEFVDAAALIRFTPEGEIDEGTYENIGQQLGSGRYVIPGFYGALPDGRIKTFSRGGSDITGAIVARATQSRLYENWSDVSGFLMADPAIVDTPRQIKEITYQELRELSYMGATVLHDEAIYPLRNLDIPIHIRNTMDPEHPGTRILRHRVPEQPVCGIAGSAGFTMINMEKAFMNKQKGFGVKVLQVLEEFDVSWEHMPTGIDTISLIIRDDQLGEHGPAIVRELEKRIEPDAISLSPGLAIIATVGIGMNHHIGVAARLTGALAEAKVNLRVIDQGSSEMNIIVGVDEPDLANTVRAIYEVFADWKG